MTGLAKRAFQERHPQQLLKEEGDTSLSWPSLEKARQNGAISSLDIAFARHCKAPSEAVATFLCHLLVAARQGHLCVAVGTGGLFPDPYVLWVGAKEWLPHLADLLLSGASTLPPCLLARPELLAIDPLPESVVCAYGESYYLQKNWVYETRFAYHLGLLQRHCAPLPLPQESLPSALQPEQAMAIRHAFEQGVTFISGGPGTGKTYTAGHLARLFIVSQDKPCHVALLAPTGKAAIRLQGALARQLSPLPSHVTLTSGTIHKALGLSPYRSSPRHHALSPLAADLLIVDEASMIDVRLMADLLAAVKEGARVVFLGDKDQLPPVEAGALFAEITRTTAPWVVTLQACLRTDIADLADMAVYIKTGQIEQALELLDRGSASIKHLPLQEAQTSERLGNRLPRVLRYGWDRQADPKDILDEIETFCLLTPLRQGPLGVNTLNQMLAAYCSLLTRPHHWPASPIIITRNAPALDLYNGETGLLITPTDGTTPPFAWFKAPDGIQARKIVACQLPDYESAYCLSVHKSQGSEFTRVALLVPPGAEVFGREILYTAITRARKEIEILGDTDTLRMVLAQETHRLSACASRLALERR